MRAVKAVSSDAVGGASGDSGRDEDAGTAKSCGVAGSGRRMTADELPLRRPRRLALRDVPSARRHRITLYAIFCRIVTGVPPDRPSQSFQTAAVLPRCARDS